MGKRHRPEGPNLFDHMVDDFVDPRDPADVADDLVRLRKLFKYDSLRFTVEMLVNAHPAWTDYIDQAPVTALFFDGAIGRVDTRHINYMKWRAREIGKDGPRLKALFQRLRIPMAYRRFKAQSFIAGAHGVLGRVRDHDVPASVMAQAIPTTINGQQWLLRALQAWDTPLSMPQYWTWAVKALGEIAHRRPHYRPNQRTISYHANDLRDLVRAGIEINPRWSWDRAIQSHHRWVGADGRGGPGLSKESKARAHAAECNLDWDEEFPTLANVPDLVTIEPKRGKPAKLTLLSTPQKMCAEAVAMRHCVQDYIPNVANGLTCIYHYEQEGEKGLTVQCQFRYADKYGTNLLAATQIRAAGNDLPTTVDRQRVKALIDKANLIIATKGENDGT